MRHTNLIWRSGVIRKLSLPKLSFIQIIDLTITSEFDGMCGNITR